MKTSLVALLGYATASDFLTGGERSIDQVYAQYLAQFRKNYLTAEEHEFRKQIFAKTHYTITQHNKAGKSWTMAHNHMSDWTEQERNAVNGRARTTGQVPQPPSMPYEGEVKDFNWQHKLKSMAHIKDQGQCGSCWAFSTIGSIEAATELLDGVYTSLSEQQVVDCSTEMGNSGCGGGLYEGGFQYSHKNGNEKETAYPYKAQDGFCNYDSSKVANHHTQSYKVLPPHNAQAVLDQLHEAPLSISVQANQSSFQFYSSGVLANDGSCGTELDHAIMAIGAGTENGKTYLLARNSWGPSWGWNGLIKLEFDATSCACGAFYDDTARVFVK